MSIKNIVLIGAIALAAPVASWAQNRIAEPQNEYSDPWFGTWVSGKNELTMTPWEDGIKLIESRIGEDGKPHRTTTFGRMDGWIYPEPSENTDGLTFNRIDDRTYEYVGTKAGKLMTRVRISFPLDNMTRISHTTLSNGQPADRKTVWKRKLATGTDPWYGTWQTGNTTFVMEPWEDGFLISFTRVPAKPGDVLSHGSIFGRFDGRRYRETGSPSVDYVVFERIDARTIALVHYKDDKETVTVTMTFAPDGKSRVSKTTGIEPDGTTVDRSVTWTRVEP